MVGLKHPTWQRLRDERNPGSQRHPRPAPGPVAVCGAALRSGPAARPGQRSARHSSRRVMLSQLDLFDAAGAADGAGPRVVTVRGSRLVPETLPPINF